MKKLVGLLVIMLVLSNTLNAQGNGKRGNQNFTPEQIATLQVKKMNLQLDLNQSQQDALFKLQKNQTMVRQAMRKSMLERKLNGKTLSSDKLFQLKSSRLDRMQNHKIAMQKILNQEQFAKWQTMRKGKMMSKQGCNNHQRKGQQKFGKQF